MEPIFPFHPENFSIIQTWISDRLKAQPNSHYGASTVADVLEEKLQGSIQENGLGDMEAFKKFKEVIIPAVRAQNHPLNLAYVPACPTPSSLMFDCALVAANIFGGSWEAGSGAIHAENQVLAWLAGAAGFPKEAGGVFVSGGTTGNLSALHAARHKHRTRLSTTSKKWAILASDEAHSSIAAVARVMDVELKLIPTDNSGKIRTDCLLDTFNHDHDPERFFAIVGNAGATNSGAVDDLQFLANFAEQNNIWLHIDGAFGLAALANNEAKKIFKGIEKANSFIVDPHKWLFAPYDCCALIYRDPMDGADAHAQKAVYLDSIQKDNWNPTNYAIHLSRKARGLPLWFSLVSYGTHAYSRAIENCIQTAKEIADGIKNNENLELIIEPQLSILVFRPKTMSDDEIDQWSDQNMVSGKILCLPTKWRDQKVLRICVVNPETQAEQVLACLNDLY